MADDVLPPVRIPKDAVERQLLADMAGLTEEERLALDRWCYQQEVEYRERLAAAGRLLEEAREHAERVRRRYVGSDPRSYRLTGDLFPWDAPDGSPTP